MTQPIDDVTLLENCGWVLDCESPLEIRSKDTGDRATGIAAKLVIQSLRFICFNGSLGQDLEITVAELAARVARLERGGR
jgi:hypothetical protein